MGPSLSESASLDQLVVTIDGENHSLAAIPETSKLVLRAKRALLQEMDLDDLLKKLRMAGQLLYVAYNGVGTQPVLRGQLSELQVKYMRLSGSSADTMASFGGRCEEMLEKSAYVFEYLLSGDEAMALVYLQEVGEVAASMAEKAAELERSYSNFTDDATRALARAEEAKGTEEQKQLAYERAKGEYLALSEGAKVLVEGIAKQKEKLQKLYEEAKEAAEKHENRAFAMEMTGAIFGGLGQGLGAAASMMAASKMPVSLPAAAPAPAAPTPAAGQPAAGKTDADKAKEDLETATTELTKAKDAVAEAEEDAETAEANVVTLKESIKKAEATTSTPAAAPAAPVSELKEKLKAAEAAVPLANSEVTAKKELLKPALAKEGAARQKYELAAAALAGVGGALSGAGAGLASAGANYATIAASYNTERQNYLKMILQQQEEEGKALAKIKEYAVRMENLTADVAIAEVVIRALQQALAALRQIVVILDNTTRLWKGMAQHCRGLSGGSKNLENKVKLMSTRSPAERIKFYSSVPNLKSAVTLLAGWKALHMVTSDYAACIRKERSQLEANVEKTLSTPEMLDIAISQGKVLSKSASDGIAGNTAQLEVIKAAQAAAA
jgi:hypothetical protein